MPGVDKLTRFVARAATTQTTQATQAVTRAGKTARRTSEVVMHLPATASTYERKRSYSLQQPGQPRSNFSTTSADGSISSAATPSDALVPYQHDLAEMARPMKSLANQYRDKHGKFEKGNPAAAALTSSEYMLGLTTGQIPLLKPRKYGIDSQGQIYIAGINANGRQSGHIDLMARIDAKAKSQQSTEPRMVMAGMVVAREREDGSIELMVGNQSGHTMPEGDPLQDQFAQAAFGQAFPQATVFTQRFLGRDAKGQSAYRQVPRDDVSTAERTAVTERIAAEWAMAAPTGKSTR